MNFGTLKSRILATIGRAPNDVCYELVTADINQELRLSVMESTTDLTEAASIALPADFLEVMDLYRDTTPRTSLRPVTTHQLNRQHVQSGIPCEYAIVDGNILLNPAPNGAETLKLRYYAKLADLADDADENDILTTYPSIYIYGALSHHAALIRDAKMLPMWFQAYEKAKTQAVQDSANLRYGAAPIRPVVAAAP